MLTDELAPLETRIGHLEPGDDLGPMLQRIRAGWRRVLFSNADECSLRRYYRYHLEGISKISDTLSSPSSALAQQLLLELTDHLWGNYRCYLDIQLAAPLAFRSRWYANIRPVISALQVKIAALSISVQLKACLAATLAKDPLQDSYTFYALHYSENLMRRLSALLVAHPGAGEAQLDQLLLELNFNHLSYYAYRQQVCQLRVARCTVPEKLDYYHRELRSLNEQPEQTQLIYDSGWPSLKTLLSNFIREEILYLKAIDPLPQILSPAGKIPLNLSVAQLACLLRLLFEEGCFGEVNLQAIFQLFAAHFRSKRQEQISPQSLSKEYYSISQVTAAVMRDKLSRMANRINRNFFPV